MWSQKGMTYGLMLSVHFLEMKKGIDLPLRHQEDEPQLDGPETNPELPHI